MYQGLAKNTCNVSVMGSIPIVSTSPTGDSLIDFDRFDNLEQTSILVYLCNGSSTGLSRQRRGFDSLIDRISRVRLEMVPAWSHKPNYVGSNPALATNVLLAQLVRAARS